MTTDAPAIHIRALSKTYRLGFLMNRQVRALQALDLSVAPGQVYGLLGPNGAGKSTTIKILMNLVRPSSGEARLLGQLPSETAARRDIGFLPENPAPYEYLTGREFVQLSARLAGVPGRELNKRVDEVLAEVDMLRSANLPIRRYSKGMVQRIGLAQARVHRPKLLILDEPTSGLDPVGRRLVRDLVLAERARGATILFCTHIIPDVETLCDRVAVLVGGKLMREGSVQELLTSQTPVMEVGLAGLAPDAVKGLGVPVENVEQVAGQLLLRVADANVQPLLSKALHAGGKVTRVQPARFSLEDLFLQALGEAGKATVGGELS